MYICNKVKNILYKSYFILNLRHLKSYNMTAEPFDLETLITLVQQRSSIYNYRDKEHSNRDIQDKLWKEISSLLKLIFFFRKFKLISIIQVKLLLKIKSITT